MNARPRGDTDDEFTTIIHSIVLPGTLTDAFCDIVAIALPTCYNPPFFRLCRDVFSHSPDDADRALLLRISYYDVTLPSCRVQNDCVGVDCGNCVARLPTMTVGVVATIPVIGA